MRIRKSASRILGLANSVTAGFAPNAVHPSKEPLTSPPMTYPSPCFTPEAFTRSNNSERPAVTSGETCELSRSPWDLVDELSISDPLVEDNLFDKYFVHVPPRASWLLTTNMPGASAEMDKRVVGISMDDGANTSQPQLGVEKKDPRKLTMRKNKGMEPKHKEKVKIVDDQELVVKQPTYMCSRLVNRAPNSIYDYNFNQKHGSLATTEAEVEAPESAAIPKPVIRSKSQRKKKKRRRFINDFGATDCFYYYGGYGPVPKKGSSRTDNDMNMSVFVTPEKEELEDKLEDNSPANQHDQAAINGLGNNVTTVHDNASRCDDIIGNASADEESNYDDHRLGDSDCYMIGGNSEHGDGKRKNGWKKP